MADQSEVSNSVSHDFFADVFSFFFASSSTYFHYEFLLAIHLSRWSCLQVFGLTIALCLHFPQDLPPLALYAGALVIAEPEESEAVNTQVPVQDIVESAKAAKSNPRLSHLHNFAMLDKK